MNNGIMMSNCKTIMVTSCKGGVGKSTVSANLAIRLALDGYRTLVIDCDFGVRSLDLIMGLEDRVIFDITDIILRNIEPEKAVIADERSENLFFCSAPYSYNNDIEPETFKEYVDKIKTALKLDYIIIDTPGDTGIPFRLAAAASQSALIISTYQPASIRAAERTGILLDELGVKSKKLIINCFNADGIEFGVQPSILEIIDKTGLQLIGIIPYDEKLSEKQACGQDVFTLKKSNAAIAFQNISKRVVGYNIGLFTDFKKVKRLSLLKKIQ